MVSVHVVKGLSWIRGKHRGPLLEPGAGIDRMSAPEIRKAYPQRGVPNARRRANAGRLTRGLSSWSAAAVLWLLCWCQPSAPSNAGMGSYPGNRRIADPIGRSSSQGNIAMMRTPSRENLSGAGRVVRGDIDYHAQCSRDRQSCRQWRGIACSEVDKIITNLRRYERDYDSLQRAKGAQSQLPSAGGFPALSAVCGLRSPDCAAPSAPPPLPAFSASMRACRSVAPLAVAVARPFGGRQTRRRVQPNRPAPAAAVLQPRDAAVQPQRRTPADVAQRRQQS